MAPPAAARAATETSLGRDNLLSIFEFSVGPCAFVFSLWALAYWFDADISP